MHLNINKQRFEVLDIFRGVFALVIILFHTGGETCSFLGKNNFIRNGDLFVDFFFVLSGFVIMYSYESNIVNINAAITFIKKRFLRLYPLHLAMLFAFLLYFLVRKATGLSFEPRVAETYNFGTFFENLFLINSIKFLRVNSLSWNYPSWSISAEMITYFAFALFSLAVNKLSSIFKVLFAGVVIILLILCTYFLFKTLVEFSTFNNSFLRSMIGFFVGVCCQIAFQQLFSRVGGKSILFTFLEIIVLLSICYFVIFGSIFRSYGLIYEAVFFIAVLVFAFEKGLISTRVKKITILKNLGKYSYSIYMTHSLVLIFEKFAFKRIIDKNNLTDTLIDLFAIVCVYFLAQWTFKNIELRFQGKKRRSEVLTAP